VSATGPVLARIGVEDSLLGDEQKLQIITEGSHFWDAAHAPSEDSVRLS
jgi:hypothetical protein